MYAPQSFSEGPLSLELAAREGRDRYLAHLVRSAFRYVVTRLFSTSERAARAREHLRMCYVQERGLTVMPDAGTMAARRSNDHEHRDSRAA
jgi:hypothetical protein